ncbi:MAG TPA: hypothetical protein VGP25_17885 [Gemmatimonadaceae bacterium]|nr:hypothetical protein [Gemmatimonadaceae bacterium]
MPHKSSEGSEEQRRAKAREARAEGKRPSEMSATTGASKQTKRATPGMSHQERMDQRNEGKEAKSQKSGSSKPRPGNRETDPSRNKRGGSSGVSE